VDQADAFILGYTCVNDITAADIISRDATFAQWARAKGFDDFCPFGPVIASGIDPAKLVVRTVLNGEERQSYPISDMIFSAQQLVSKISHDMTLLPGDLICCGTSLGVGSMKDPINKVTVAIDGMPLSGSIPELSHVAKVENRTTLKISRKVIFREL
jgi:2-keto-4-pentenoate hydratase/2-oxohepta-3-ene-1,7-dioic acid hydratase in catechol pathway